MLFVQAYSPRREKRKRKKPQPKPELSLVSQTDGSCQVGSFPGTILSMLTIPPRWTKQQLNSARSMWLAGVPASKIAVKVGKTRNSVVGKLQRLGLFKIENRPRTTPEPKRKVVSLAVP